VENAILSDPGDPYWERQRASYERSLELSKLAREYQGDYGARGYDVALHVIRAKYNIVLAEIAQVDNRDLKRSSDKMAEAARQLQDAFLMAQGKQKTAIASLQDQLHLVSRSVSLCHGQSRGDNRGQYLSLFSAVAGMTRSLLAGPTA